MGTKWATYQPFKVDQTKESKSYTLMLLYDKVFVCLFIFCFGQRSLFNYVWWNADAGIM